MTEEQQAYDDAYEFEAPKFVDFGNGAHQEAADDTWFQGRKSSLTSRSELPADEEPIADEDTEMGEASVDVSVNATNMTNTSFHVMEVSQSEVPAAPVLEVVPRRTRSMTREEKKRKSDPKEQPSTRHNKAQKKTPTDTAPKLTVPLSPKFKAPMHKKKAMTSEELEMQRIEREIQEAKKARLRRKKNRGGSRTTALPVRSTKPLTIPNEFHFRSDSRIRHNDSMNSSTDSITHTPSKLRYNPNKLTEPKPFVFRTDSLHRTRASKQLNASTESLPSGGNSKWVSQASQVNAFQTKTPQRFRTKASDAPSPYKPHLTKPRSPKFRTAQRRRPTSAVEQSVREMEEMNSIEKFKARPVNKKIMESCGDLGVPKVPKRELTQPMDIKFHSDSRVGRTRATTEERSVEKPFVFKARAMPDYSAMNRAHTSRPVTPRKLTTPVSPNFSTKKRAATRVVHHEQENSTGSSHGFKARPMPCLESPWRPHKEEKPLTSPHPFRLATEMRGQVYKQEFEHHVHEQEMRDRAMRDFHAQPIPVDVPSPVSVQHKPPTDPHPFNLQTEKRGEVAKSEWEHKLNEELENEQMQFSAFKAQPCPVSSPYQVHKSMKPLTEITDITLNTDRRSEKRKDFDKYNAEVHKHAEEAKRAREMALKEQEEEEIKMLRKQLVHKPTPIMKSKGFKVKPSDRPLTDPRSPVFKSRMSRRMQV